MQENTKEILNSTEDSSKDKTNLNESNKLDTNLITINTELNEF